jgi:hypothetical protein
MPLIKQPYLKIFSHILNINNKVKAREMCNLL